MKKIIAGRIYDTDTATDIGFTTGGEIGSFTYWSETLFRKRTGEYFLLGEGGPMTRYAVSSGSNTWTGSHKIIPLTYENARQWAEKALDADDYQAEFGPVADDDTRVTVTLSLPADVLAKAKQDAARAETNLSAYIAQIITRQD